MNLQEVQITDNLQKFIDFANDHYGFWSEFTVETTNADSCLEPWLGEHPNFEVIRKAFIVLGRADGTGSHFAFWDDNTGKSIDEMPIVILGSEGELPLVASNLKGLMRLMTTEDELTILNMKAWVVSECVGTYDDEYALWLKKEFGLKPIKTEKEANDIIAEASKQFGEAFILWLKNTVGEDYVPDEDEDEDIDFNDDDDDDDDDIDNDDDDNDDDDNDDDDEPTKNEDITDVRTLIRMGKKAALAENFEEATKYYTQALSIEPNNIDVYNDWAAQLSYYGQRKQNKDAMLEGARKWEKLVEIGRKSECSRYYSNIGILYLDIARIENRLLEDKEHILSPLLKSNELLKGSGSYSLACYFSLINDVEKALEWLELSASVKSPTRSHMEIDSDLDNIRKDSRFVEILDKYMLKKK